MEDRYQHTVPGQEINESDINLVATEASLADDHVFAELIRLGSGAKAVFASGPLPSILRASGSSDAKIIVSPFRAFIGPISPSSTLMASKDARSVIAANSVDTTPVTIQFAAVIATNRWDLVYARVDVDVDGTSDLRFVKTGPTPASQQSIVITKKTAVTIGRVQGTEAGSPTKPAIPADSGSSYYIALGYVLLRPGHTLTVAIDPANIDEIAPVRTLSHATGAATLAVANGMYLESGVALVNETWAPTAGRPRAYLPPTMGGKKELIFSVSQVSGNRTIPLSGNGIIDDSVDWRRRMFRVMACIGDAGHIFPWSSPAAGVPAVSGTIAVPNPLATPQNTLFFAGQSFADDGTSTVGSAGAIVASLNPATTGGKMSGGSALVIYVDLTDGKLKAFTGPNDPNTRFFFWLEATGRFDNAF